MPMNANDVQLEPETKAKVLLVDDRPDKLLALSAILEDMGQEVVTARSGQEALRCLLKDDFAVILLDVNMPQMDGFETAALIRERARSEKTPIIFLTAYSEAEAQAARGYSLGAVDYIQLPVQPDVLKAKVAVFVDLFRKSERIRQQAAEVTDRLHFETRRNRFFTLAVDMLGIAGFDCYFRQLNPAWERALGLSDAELRERPFVEFLHPDDRAAANSAFRRLAEDLFTARFEARHRHKAGGYRWLAWSAAAFKEEGLVYVFAHDVTDRKAAEEDRLQLVREQEARRTAQRENEIKDQFLATLSHELRAPLTPILSWTSLLRSGLVDPESVARGIEVIDRNVRLQVRLVEDLLDTSRIISGKLHVERRGMDLLAVIEAGLEAVGPAILHKRLQLEVHLPDTPVWIQGDPQRLQQVVWNLVSNACKFTAEGGRVEVRLERSGESVRLSVSDSGIGITADFLPHVFDRFRQAETGSARKFGGLGLGLTIVRHVVEAHGGTVEAYSAGAGAGSCFSVTLPAQPAAAPPDEPKQADHPGSHELGGLPAGSHDVRPRSVFEASSRNS
jgi:PAS domain S-box-containing protein